MKCVVCKKELAETRGSSVENNFVKGRAITLHNVGLIERCCDDSSGGIVITCFGPLCDLVTSTPEGTDYTFDDATRKWAVGPPAE